MRLSQHEIKRRAVEFSDRWKDETRERAESQSFWNEFFEVFGVDRKRVATFDQPSKRSDGRDGFIDLLWRQTLLVEHKSRGHDLEKAFGQATDYFPGLKDEELPQYILVSDFERLRLHNLESNTSTEFFLSDLHKNVDLFGFISGYIQRVYREEDPVTVKVAVKMGELHQALRKSGYGGHELEVFLVRIVFCLFADKTGVFDTKGEFENILKNHARNDGSDMGQLLATIFQVLNAPRNHRQTTLDDDLLALPHINGNLFAEHLNLPIFDSEMRAILLDCAMHDWSRVSPAIFGSLFQAVMEEDDRELRRAFGAHYTSEANILKVIQGLYLDALNAEFQGMRGNLTKLREFRKKLAKVRFFDPACGCGNFLVVAYRELRRLETRVLKEFRKESTGDQMEISSEHTSAIDVDCCYGFEIHEFPVEIAKVALWITDHMMNMELSAATGEYYVRLPLDKAPVIRQENALRTNWSNFLAQSEDVYVLGNPPFRGRQFRTDEQRQDMELVFANKIVGYGVLDYVAAWYIKAVEYIKGSKVHCAFVSTNSITQGEQVGVLWPYLLGKGLKITFAHRTFRWTSEATGTANVFCVIIGFSLIEPTGDRPLYEYATPDAKPKKVAAWNINPYLSNAHTVIVKSRNTPLDDVPTIRFGSMPNDGGHLILSTEEKRELIREEPLSKKFIKRFMGSQEFLNGEERWCLWLKDATPAELRSMKKVRERIEAVRKHREASTRDTTRELANSPSRFGEDRQPESRYLMIPSVSSERRHYLPIAYMSQEVIASNLCLTVAAAKPYHFGVLSSIAHTGWLRAVGGRLEGRYRYSNNVVYNTFPWPTHTTIAKIKSVETIAKTIVAIRKSYASSTLADLYDPDTMPADLLKAHRRLDRAVDRCYRNKGFKDELDRLDWLLNIYKVRVEELAGANLVIAPRGNRK